MITFLFQKCLTFLLLLQSIQKPFRKSVRKKVNICNKNHLKIQCFGHSWVHEVELKWKFWEHSNFNANSSGKKINWPLNKSCGRLQRPNVTFSNQSSGLTNSVGMWDESTLAGLRVQSTEQNPLSQSKWDVRQHESNCC